MYRSIRHHIGAAALTVLLAACGGSDDGAVSQAPSTAPIAAPPAPVVASRAEVLATTAGGMGGIAFSGGAAYMTVSNSGSADSGMFRAALPLQATSIWSGMALGECGIGREEAGFPLRAGALRALESGLWLVQTWYDKAVAEGGGIPAEHALCALRADRGAFEARDSGLTVCLSGFCSILSPSDIKQVGNRLYTNAGGGQNVLVSNDGGVSWKVVTGRFDQDICTNPAFEVVGDRLLVGGECPLDMAFLRAYRLGGDGASLASADALPLSLPNLENRNVQFIRATGGQRVFAGVEGGLLRSVDGGNTFKFVIEQPVGGGNQYPYIRHLLALSGKPDTMVAGGFDKAIQKPYLAWSADGGATWTDISPLLPGYARNVDGASTAMVTSLAEDPQGRVLVTVNEHDNADGRLVLLTLGTPGH